MGCTTGAKIFEKENIVVIFKNKDFQTENFSDKLSIKYSHAFGVQGVNLRTQSFGGFSIGVNHHGLVAVNSNVVANSNLPYDFLTERIVLEAKTINDAISICKNELSNGKKYQWCNMIIATPTRLAAIELSSLEVKFDYSSEFLVRTNHHLLLETKDKVISLDPEIKTFSIRNSENRYNLTHEMLESATNIESIKHIMKFHHPASSICRHGQATPENRSYTTVYGYLAIISLEEELRISISVVKGSPCENEFRDFKLDFPLTDQRHLQIYRNYPF